MSALMPGGATATPTLLGRPLHLELVSCRRCGAWDCPAKWGRKKCPQDGTRPEMTGATDATGVAE